MGKGKKGKREEGAVDLAGQATSEYVPSSASDAEILLKMSRELRKSMQWLLTGEG
jgi:hypothetical protein